LRWGWEDGALAAAGRETVRAAATPFQAPFEAFLPEYERRVARGEKWPGWVEKIGRIEAPAAGQMPSARSICCDDVVLARVCSGAGWEVERAWLTAARNLPASRHLDGRESVGLVARSRLEVTPQAFAHRRAW